jgi:hypothetical protein
LLKIHVILGLTSEVIAVTSKAEAFTKASSATLQVDVPTASAASTVPGPGVGDESKKTDLEATMAARILHLEAAMTTRILQVEAAAT